jgi:hypothetical protein
MDLDALDIVGMAEGHWFVFNKAGFLILEESASTQPARLLIVPTVSTFVEPVSTMGSVPE